MVGKERQEERQEKQLKSYENSLENKIVKRIIIFILCIFAFAICYPFIIQAPDYIKQLQEVSLKIFLAAFVLDCIFRSFWWLMKLSGFTLLLATFLRAILVPSLVSTLALMLAIILVIGLAYNIIKLML